MSDNNPENIKEHKRLIAAMVNKLLSEGYKVSAGHIGYPNGSPGEFNKYVPDIYAEKKGKKLIVEAETCNSLKDKEMRLRWIALSAVEGIEFSVITPRQCSSVAKSLASKWNLKIKHYWKLNI